MEETLQKIDAQAGQVWRMRNGKTITIERIDPENGDFPILVEKQSWMATGRYWSPEQQHSRDLIKQILE
jgi:hypothetical protein